LLAHLPALALPRLAALPSRARTLPLLLPALLARLARLALLARPFALGCLGSLGLLLSLCLSLRGSWRGSLPLPLLPVSLRFALRFSLGRGLLLLPASPPDGLPLALSLRFTRLARLACTLPARLTLTTTLPLRALGRAPARAATLLCAPLRLLRCLRPAMLLPRLARPVGNAAARRTRRRRLLATAALRTLHRTTGLPAAAPRIAPLLRARTGRCATLSAAVLLGAAFLPTTRVRTLLRGCLASSLGVAALLSPPLAHLPLARALPTLRRAARLTLACGARGRLPLPGLGAARARCLAHALGLRGLARLCARLCTRLGT
jgi:hypothetical protein